jgi:hypothetical protein
MARHNSGPAATATRSEPKPICLAAIDPKNSASRLRLQRLAERLHALGPKPLFHFLDELERGADLRTHLEAYAKLPEDFIRANRGDQFAPSIFAVRRRS